MDLFQPCAPRIPRKLYSVQVTADNIDALADQLDQGAIENGRLVFVGGRRWDGRSGVVTASVGDWVVKVGPLVNDTFVFTNAEYHEQYMTYPEPADH